MIQIESNIQIERPRESVFAFLTDVGNIPRWQKSVIQSRPVSTGPMRIGFQFAENAKVGPWRINTVCTVTDLRQDQRFAFEAKSSGPLEYRGSFELQPVAGGTRLTLSGSARLKGLWRLLQPLLAGDLRKESRDELETLKRVLEQEAGVAGAA